MRVWEGEGIVQVQFLWSLGENCTVYVRIPPMQRISNQPYAVGTPSEGVININPKIFNS